MSFIIHFFQQGIAGVVFTRPSFLLAFDNYTLPNQIQRLICLMSLFSCVSLKVVVFFFSRELNLQVISSPQVPDCVNRLLSVYLVLFQYLCSVYFRSLSAGVPFQTWQDRESIQRENKKERHWCRKVSFSNLILIHQV